MAWLEGYTITNGIYQAYAAPVGDLSQGVAGAAVNAITGGINFDRTRRSDTDPDNWKWPGAYGMQDPPLMTRLDEDIDHGWQYNILLAEIPVKNASGATYFKQTICFYISFNVANYTYPQGNERLYTINVGGKMTRRVYPNQGTYYTETTICEGGATLQFSMVSGTGIVGWVKERLMVGMSPLTYQNTEYFGFYLYCETGYTDAAIERSQLVGAAAPMSTLETLFGEFEPVKKEDPNEEDNPPGPGSGGSGGGNGDHILPNETIPIPPLPEIGAGSPSWLTLYKMTLPELSEFGQELITPTLWQAIKAFFTDPLDAIVGILLCPVNIPTTRTKTPSCGQYSWTNAYPVCSSEFYELDCGTIEIPPYWDSAFDMDPFTRLTIVLPYIGAKQINADEVMGCTLGVKYHIDVCTGDCIAFVTKYATSTSKYGSSPFQVIGQYNGNCGVRVPIGRVSHDNAIEGCLSLMTTGIQAVGTIAGNTFGSPENIPASQIANQVSGATMSVVNGMKQRIERSGNIAAAGGYMAIQKPYIIRSIPRQVLPDNYKRLEGYPMQKGGTLLQYQGTGLNTVEAIELGGFMGYNSEQEEIITLLQGGVLI